MIMPKLRCPVCGGELSLEGRAYRCEKGHSYDVAKQNYVNLLMSNRSSAKRHGDDKLMVKARKDFLEKDYYLFLREEICRLALSCRKEGTVDFLDAGCGEGWYTSALREALEQSGGCSCLGVDISKEALMAAGRRDKSALWAVGSINSLPVGDESCDIILNVFAPHDDGEFRRVLRPGGIVIKVMPLETHLWGLKKAVYAKPYLNGPAEYAPEGFEPVCRSEKRAMLRLESAEDIQNLFMMTPYYYKTGREDQEKLRALDFLETEADFAICVLRKL